MKLGYRESEYIFKDYLTSCGYKERSVYGILHNLKYLFRYLEKNIIDDLRDVKRETVLGFAEYLNTLISRRTGSPIQMRTRQSIYGSVKLLFKSLYLLEHIIMNPCEGFEAFSKSKTKLKAVFTQEEIGCILDDIEDVRDRALFELMYSSALRCSDVTKLDTGDVDFEARLIHIREGKFSKDRIVPISEVAVKFLRQYLRGRMRNKQEPLFYGKKNRARLGPTGIRKTLKKILMKQKSYRSGLSPHSIRHSTASHLLMQGCSVRYVQELLGHASLETTTKYTHMSIDNLKRVYKSSHPRENEYFEEIGGEYLRRIRKLKNELEECRQKRSKRREVRQNRD